MQSIYNPMAEDVRGPIHLNTAVTKVEHPDSEATLTFEDGSTRSAAAVIVTAPIGALKHLEFAPQLPESMRAIVDEGTNSTGFKIWIKIKGHHSFIATAPTGNPLAMTKSEYFMEDGNTILVGFGPDHTKIDLHDVEQVQELLSRWRPELEVLEVDGFDWSADKWSGQTWASTKSGQFTDGWHHFHNTDSRLYFAGADIAKGWNGVVVDGAIETGITTARRVLAELRTEQTA